MPGFRSVYIAVRFNTINTNDTTNAEEGRLKNIWFTDMTIKFRHRYSIGDVATLLTSIGWHCVGRAKPGELIFTRRVGEMTYRIHAQQRGFGERKHVGVWCAEPYLLPRQLIDEIDAVSGDPFNRRGNVDDTASDNI